MNCRPNDMAMVIKPLDVTLCEKLRFVKPGTIVQVRRLLQGPPEAIWELAEPIHTTLTCSHGTEREAIVPDYPDAYLRPLTNLPEPVTKDANEPVTS